MLVEVAPANRHVWPLGTASFQMLLRRPRYAREYVALASPDFGLRHLRKTRCVICSSAAVVAKPSPMNRQLMSSHPSRRGRPALGQVAGADVLHRDDLLALVDISRELASEIHLPRLLHRILDAATRLTDSPDGSVILLDETRDCLYFADAVGPSAALLLERWGKASDQNVPILGSKAGQVFTSGVPAIVDAIPDDPNHFKGVDEDTKRQTSSMACVPLTVTSRRTGSARTLGVLQILNKRGGNYTERDAILLQRFADQAAVALENAQLVSDLFAHMGLYSTSDGADPVKTYTDLRSRPAWHETLSVLFADMRGFTQLCQVIGRPELAQESLNEFLTTLAEAVITHQGVVNKFLGDGLMALFRNENHARNAVDCAFAMLRSFDDLKRRWDDRSNLRLTFLDLGIGISTEDVILGSIGSDRVWDFTAIGTGVNLAAHLMEHARDGRRLLVDKVTFRAVQDQITRFDGPEQFELRKPGQTVAHPYERFCLVNKSGEIAETPAPRPQPMTPAAGPVFIGYSHGDARWLSLLQKHLKPYIRAGSIEAWDDTKFTAGDKWRASIRDALDRARVAVLIVSPNFLESEFIAHNELPPLLQAARARGVKILWIPVTASSYEETQIGDFQAALSPANPLDAMPEAQQHEAMVNVCRRIKAALQTDRAGADPSK
jgi:class 3 adenylate cyclase